MPNLEIFRFDPNSRIYDAGDLLFCEGEPGDTMFVLLEGTVELTLHGSVLEVVQPGGTFGEMALVQRSIRSASAVAVTQVRAVAIDERRFVYLVQNTPTFALEVLRTLAGRLRAMDARL
jgi:CRP-like cAMP-binding protein